MSEYITKDDLASHMHIEEQLQEETNARLQEGNLRMARIEEDLRPLRALYNAVLGASALGTMLIILLVYIYNGDRDEFRMIAASVHKQGEVLQGQGVVLEKLIQAHQELEKDTTKEFQRIEKALDKHFK